MSIAFEDESRSISDRGANLEFKEDDLNFELLRKTWFVMRAGHWNTEGLFQANEKILRFAQSANEDVHTGVDIGWSAYFGWTAHARKTVFDFLPSTDLLFVNEAEIKGLSGERKCMIY